MITKTKILQESDNPIASRKSEGTFCRLLRALIMVLGFFGLFSPLSASAADVTLSGDAASGYYINMPKTGTNTLTLTDASITTFKVYDDGGKDGDYSNDCDGYLAVNVPKGYVIYLSGSVVSEGSDWDPLSVYDGNTTSSAILVDQTGGIQLVEASSTGNSMLLYFKSEYSNAYSGLDLTIQLIDVSKPFDITVSQTKGGSVSSDVKSAKTNSKVTLTATPDKGYMLSDFGVRDDNGKVVATEGHRWYDGNSNKATFIMPAFAVTVTPEFGSKADGLFINMPKTGRVTATIPQGVNSFKIYDHGEKDGDYSTHCNGYLEIKAPEGYDMRLSGTVTSEVRGYYLSVYDGDTESSTKIIDEAGNNEGQPIDIFSKSNSLLLYFHSNEGYSISGLNLAVSLFKRVSVTFNYKGKPAVTKMLPPNAAIVLPTAKEILGDDYKLGCYEFSFTDVEGNVVDGSTIVKGEMTVNCELVKSEVFNGNGTQENPYQIGSANLLALFRDTANKTDNTVCGKLTADIDLSSVCSASLGSWTPIGLSNSYSYKGTFDGQGYLITGLYINNKDDEIEGFGLFGWTEDAEISNLDVTGDVTSNNDNSAIIAGSGVYTTFTNCISRGVVNGPMYVAGIAGDGGSNSTFSKCSNYASIHATNSIAGGIVGSYAKSVSDCVNAGSISADSDGYGNYTIGKDIDECSRCLNVAAPGANVTENADYYYYNGTASESLTADMLANGELAAKLQGSETEPHWAQAIGIDSYPTPYNAAKVNTDNYVYYDNGAWKCSTLKVTDGKALPVGLDFTAENVVNSRTLAMDGKAPYTICLPYDLDYSTHDGYTAYTLSSVNEDNSTVYFDKESGNVLSADTPYLIMADKGDVSLNASNVEFKANASAGSVAKGNVTMVGTLDRVDNDAAVADGAYILQSDNNWHKISRGDKYGYVLPYRAYLKFGPAYSAKPNYLMALGGETTGITRIGLDDGDGNVRYYNLRGQYVGKSLNGKPAGVYIVNGKKIIKK